MSEFSVEKPMRQLPLVSPRLSDKISESTENGMCLKYLIWYDNCGYFGKEIQAIEKYA